jgi:3-hydroxy-9,10-secoandrosta-1,3,5(10)-triene-9,17-dione monooxygenase reductase component
MARLVMAELVPTSAEWRAAMSSFPTGVTIVTSWADREPVGSTINAFCSVSLEPPMLLICLDRANPLVVPVEQSGVFGVNILCEDSQHVALRFARPPLDSRFSEFGYHSVGKGAPQLDAAPVFVDCRVENTYSAGDHLVLIGRGVRVDHVSVALPLVYHKSRFARFPPTT